ncbi:MAG TPA: exosome complex RNA-binding protein Rrp4 [Thermoplasmata archaeon]|nr:exosome complex RNA-binding protein Rrp4 [Thermoplasmata archaeon]
MGRGHRPGPRRHAREDASSHGPGDRTLVLPGEELPSHGLKPGPGTYRVGGRVYASVLGLLSPRPPMVRVVPLSGRYIPKAGDDVIGTVTDVQTTFWLLDIGAPRWAPLHMTGTPWKIEVGETDQYLRVGDAVLVQVESLDPTGRIGVTMNGEGLGKLEGGTIVTISPARVPRVVGRGGSMIQTILRRTGAKISVGQNGRIWVGGDAVAIERVREVLRMIDEEGHRRGLTERVDTYLQSTSRPGESSGRDEPAGPSPPAPFVRPDPADREPDVDLTLDRAPDDDAGID